MSENELPAEWPPRAGDVWTDREGESWFAVHLDDPELDEDEALVFVLSRAEGTEPSAEEIDDVRNWWGPLTLAYRPGSPGEVERLVERLRNLPTVYVDGATVVTLDVLHAALDEAGAGS